MRTLIITAILFFCITNISAQDLLVTPKGDSLNCKITKVKTDYIYFTFKYENEIRNTLIATQEVKSYIINFYKTPEVPLNIIKKSTSNHKKFKLEARGGWSYLTAPISKNAPSFMQDYLKELKSGSHFGASFNYFVSENIGFGINYSYFNTKHELDGVYVTDTAGQTRMGKLKDDITIQYIGPTFCTRLFSQNKKICYYSNLSVGYLHYKNNATVIDDFTLTSSTVSFMADFGIDFEIDQNLFLGFNVGLVSGALDHFDYSDSKTSKRITLNNNEMEGVSRIDLAAGLKWYW